MNIEWRLHDMNWKLTPLSYISSLIVLLIRGYIGVRVGTLDPANPAIHPYLFVALYWLSIIFSILAVLTAIVSLKKVPKKISTRVALLIAILVAADVLTSYF